MDESEGTGIGFAANVKQECGQGGVRLFDGTDEKGVADVDGDGDVLQAPFPVTVMVEESGDDTGSADDDTEEEILAPPFLSNDRKRKHRESKFMEKDDVIALLITSESSDTMVPDGLNVNHFFLLKDDKNFHKGRRRKGRNVFLVDNLMNWQNLSLKKHHYLYADGDYKYIDLVRGKFFMSEPGSRGRREASQQPDPGELLVIKKQYSSVPGKLKRRISFLDSWPEGVDVKQENLLLVEYIPADSNEIHDQKIRKVFKYVEAGTSLCTEDHSTVDNAVEIIIGGSHAASANVTRCHGTTGDALPGESNFQAIEVEEGNVREKMGIDNKGRFFDKNDAIEVLLNAESNMKEIPPGLKEDEYFVIDYEENYQRSKAGKRRLYIDDCGVWKSVSMKKHYYTCVDGNYLYVDVIAGKYRIAKSSARQSRSIDKSETLVMRKVYGSLKRDEGYKRRISWIDDFPDGVAPKQKNIALVEYIGKYPMEALPHGNQKTPGAAPYVRTPASIMRQLKEKVATKTAKVAWQDLTSTEMTPRDLKQLQNLRYRSNLKIGPGSANDDSHIDDLKQILSMVHEHTYVQQAVFTKYQPPVVIGYTSQQMNTWRFHCHEKSGLDRVIGIDRTITVGPVCLTILMYTHPNLLCKDSLVPAVLMGPIFFHVDKSWQTYSIFFNHLKGGISLIEGTDVHGVNIACKSGEEIPIVKAMNHCFPNTNVALCCTHLKKELKRFLSEEVGLVDHSVETVADEIFSELLGCTEEYDFDMKVLQLQSEYDASIPQFSHYFRRLTENIRHSMWRPTLEQRPSMQWTISTCEAFNNVSKLLASWEKLRLPELILRLYNVIRLQEQDEIRALYGEGNCVLAQHAKKYQVTKEDWMAKTNKQRARLAESLRKFKGGAGRSMPITKSESEELGSAESRYYQV